MRRLVLPVIVVAALLGACGDDGDDADDGATATTAALPEDTTDDTTEDTTDDTTEDTTDDTTEDTAGGDAEGGDADGASVTIEGFAFQPESIDVSAGTTVTWTNDDAAAHTVTAGEPGNPGDAFDEPVDGGESTEVTFDEAGTFAYFCTIHPSMTAEVVVG